MGQFDALIELYKDKKETTNAEDLLAVLLVGEEAQNTVTELHRSNRTPCIKSVVRFIDGQEYEIAIRKRESDV